MHINYDPVAWSKLFKEAGARYVIPVTKHHEGFCLWGCPDNKGWNAVDAGPKRDLVTPLADAVRAQGLKLGLYMYILDEDKSHSSKDFEKAMHLIC